jgi:hypothetical protein
MPKLLPGDGLTNFILLLVMLGLAKLSGCV